MTARGSLLLLAGLAVTASPALCRPSSADELRGAEIRISRASGPIAVDGDLGDDGWSGATLVETFYETNPGDNLPPKVRTLARLTYDDRFLYAALECDDPEPKKIRAPFSQRDVLGGDTDYGGIILDTRNDGRTAILFLANPRGIQYDAVTDDGNESSSPDFFWDAAGRLTPTGWSLEIRIPFSSLRYEKKDPQTWGILVYRNRPRDFRYQMFSARLPRGRNCFICSENVLTGLSGLPPGGNLVAAPYVTASQETVPREDGSGLVRKPAEFDAGLDVKWTPSAGVALDATLNPDFSQIESDVAKIGVNERFALFYPEKRPFFLEGVDLLSTPVTAVYTRSITSPRWGLRGTGKLDATSWTALVAYDRGGGSVILPGPSGSDLADQDFSSLDFIGRARHDLGRSFVSLLVTDKEIQGGGSNRVIGPDLRFSPSESDTVTGQLLFSRSDTPDRPDLAAEWNGQALSGHGADVWWEHSTETVDWGVEYKDFSDGFRADLGFVPQVGFREGFVQGGYTFRPKGFFSRVRPFAFGDYIADREGDLLSQVVSAGVSLDAKYNSSAVFQVRSDKVLAGDTVLPRTRLVYSVSTAPVRWLGRISVDGSIGEEIDFVGARRGHGGRTAGSVVVRPGNHLELDLVGEVQWMNVKPEGETGSKRLFTAFVERLKATYTLTARSYVRVIGQYVETRTNPELYAEPVEERSGSFSASALVAYRLNWQSVVFLGYGDTRTLSEEGGLPPGARQLFLKVSYAFQR
ncbi:MAG: carbohydrate binding family 9 domain-containing protein [Holophagales bacterium]|nr:carbohydrate binding family 9 domain-containing protein [Holophagales bacterium]